jgi:hypothetical protein
MNTQQKVIKNKVGLLKLAETWGNVSQACKVMGFSRDSFYRVASCMKPAGSWLCKRLRHTHCYYSPRNIR